MFDYQAIIALFSAVNQEQRVACLRKLLAALGITHEMRLFYWHFDDIARCLINRRHRLSLAITQTSNPVVYSFTTQKPYFIDNVTVYREFAQLFSGGNHQCFVMPIEKFGILGLYGASVDLGQQRLQKIAGAVAALFACAEKVSLQRLDLENKNSRAQEGLVLLQKRDSQLLKAAYLDHVWIDQSENHSAFRRSVLSCADSPKVLNIVGDYGSGRAYLAGVLQKLRNAYGDCQNVVDLAVVKDVIQLNSILGVTSEQDDGTQKTVGASDSMSQYCADENEQRMHFDYRYDKTLLLKHADCLSPALFKQLYALLVNNPYLKKHAVKVIITSTKATIHEDIDSHILQFFNQETLSVPRRLDHADNIEAFINAFIHLYKKDHLKAVTGVSTAASHLLHTEAAMCTLNDLKYYIDAMCDATPYGGQIDESVTKQALATRPAKDQAGLVESVAQYEKSVILRALALNNWNQRAAARQLSLPRRTLSYKCTKHKIGGKYAD